MRISDWSSDVCSSDLPSIAGAYYAFTDWRGGTEANWTGFENFIELAGDSAAVASLVNTLTIAVTLTLVQTGLGLLLALALNSAIRGRNLMQIGRASCRERGCQYV